MASRIVAVAAGSGRRRLPSAYLRYLANPPHGELRILGLAVPDPPVQPLDLSDDEDLGFDSAKPVGRHRIRGLFRMLEPHRDMELVKDRWPCHASIARIDQRPEQPYAEAQRVYARTAAAFGLPVALPLTEPALRLALSAEGTVRASQGMGGPQPAEVARMLISHRGGLAADRDWVVAVRDRLEQAAVKSDPAFAALTS